MADFKQQLCLSLLKLQITLSSKQEAHPETNEFEKLHFLPYVVASLVNGMNVTTNLKKL